MAEYLTGEGLPQRVRHLAACSLLAMTIPLSAQTLVDPTRPPASFGVKQMSQGQESDAGQVLQSVLISSRRREAIISGQTVKVGDKVGDATVHRIAEDHVVLRHGKDLKTLRLFPNIEKRSTSSRAGSRPDNRRP